MKPSRKMEQHLHEWHEAVHHLQPYRTTRALLLAALSGLTMTALLTMGSISPTNHRIEPSFHTWYVLLSNTALFLLLYAYLFAILRTGLHDVKLHAAMLGGAVAVAAVASVPIYHAEHLFYPYATNRYVITLAFCLINGLIAYLICCLLYNVTQHQRTLLEVEHLKAENTRIYHESLRQQVSPHFLFNSLNTLDSLIDLDATKAHHYLQNLSYTFRYTLQQQKVVSLREEMEFTRAYIDMMLLRFGDALHVQIDIPDTLLDSRLPPISVQLLVENAIKHNVVSMRYPLHISIVATADHQLRVSNHMQPKSQPDASSGLGLLNLSQRYNLLFGNEPTILNDNERFTVELPLI